MLTTLPKLLYPEADATPGEPQGNRSFQGANLPKHKNPDVVAVLENLTSTSKLLAYSTDDLIEEWKPRGGLVLRILHTLLKDNFVTFSDKLDQVVNCLDSNIQKLDELKHLAPEYFNAIRDNQGKVLGDKLRERFNEAWDYLYYKKFSLTAANFMEDQIQGHIKLAKVKYTIELLDYWIEKMKESIT